MCKYNYSRFNPLDLALPCSLLCSTTLSLMLSSRNFSCCVHCNESRVVSFCQQVTTAVHLTLLLSYVVLDSAAVEISRESKREYSFQDQGQLKQQHRNIPFCTYFFCCTSSGLKYWLIKLVVISDCTTVGHLIIVPTHSIWFLVIVW